MRISRRQVEEALHDLDPAARLVGRLKSSYEIASMFKPVNQGFYFSIGGLPDWMRQRDALVIVGSDTDPGRIPGPEGALIVTSKDPQLLYYSIIDRYFRRRSSGVVSSMSVIAKGAEIAEDVEIGPFCTIGDGVTVGQGSIIASHCAIESGTVIEPGVHIDAGCHIGAQGVAWVWSDDGSERIVQPQIGGVRLGESCFIGSGTIIVRGSLNESTEIGDHSLIAPGCRVGHGCRIGRHVHLANGVLLGGNVVLDDRCFVGSGAVFRPRTRIHQGTVVAAGAVIVRDTTRPGSLLLGVPAVETESKPALQGVPRNKTPARRPRTGDEHD